MWAMSSFSSSFKCPNVQHFCRKLGISKIHFTLPHTRIHFMFDISFHRFGQHSVEILKKKNLKKKKLKPMSRLFQTNVRRKKSHAQLCNDLLTLLHSWCGVSTHKIGCLVCVIAQVLVAPRRVYTLNCIYTMKARKLWHGNIIVADLRISINMSPCSKFIQSRGKKKEKKMKTKEYCTGWRRKNYYTSHSGSNVRSTCSPFHIHGVHSIRWYSVYNETLRFSTFSRSVCLSF